jgi:hypothetical protein
MKNGDELREKYEADVYILLRRNGKVFIYSSCAESFWPLTAEDMVR